MVGEFLEFEDFIVGIVLNLENDNVGVVLMGVGLGIFEGSLVCLIGKIVQILVGDGFFGCVVNLLVKFIDGKGDIVLIEICLVELMVFGIII